MPVGAPLVGEPIVTYAFDLPEQFVMANPTNLARAGISIPEVGSLACANLKSRLSRAVDASDDAIRHQVATADAMNVPAVPSFQGLRASKIERGDSC